VHPEQWAPISVVAEAVGAKPREFYRLISLGMRHSRVGRKIFVRVVDWNRFIEAHAIGTVTPAGRNGRPASGTGGSQ
jgi:hypothetical protein